MPGRSRSQRSHGGARRPKESPGQRLKRPCMSHRRHAGGRPHRRGNSGLPEQERPSARCSNRALTLFLTRDTAKKGGTCGRCAALPLDCTTHCCAWALTRLSTQMCECRACKCNGTGPRVSDAQQMHLASCPSEPVCTPATVQSRNRRSRQSPPLLAQLSPVCDLAARRSEAQQPLQRQRQSGWGLPAEGSLLGVVIKANAGACRGGGGGHSECIRNHSFGLQASL